METVGVVLNTLVANMRTEELLQQSQSLTQELQSQSEELQARQEELKRSNAELEEQAQSLKASEELLQQQQEELQQTNEELQEKAALLERQNRDIEIKNREIELARAGLEERAEQLALSSKYKSEFLANMSHELRTPLNSLLILSNMLAENPAGNLDEKQVEFAKTINTAGTDLLELINDILDLSKVEAGKMDVHASQLELIGVCDYVEQTFRPVASDKGLDFEVVVDEGAPPAITTDEQRLQQVLRNLLSNAFKFTDSGRIELHVRAAEPDVVFANEHLVGADAVAFAVTDTGIGIDSEKLRLIFEAFQQADGTTSRRYGGTGLGLSISREIARLLGGEIQATSTVGEGSAFTLYLPREYRAPEAPAAATARQVPPPAETRPAARTNEAALAGIRDDRDQISPGQVVCLVIEEDPQVARALMEAARNAGFKCIVSLRHDSGVALAADWAPDAIVVGSGLPTLLQLKQAPDTRHIPVHVVSAAAERHEALAAGAAGQIERPPADEALAAAFAELSSFIERPEKSLLIVDDEETARKSIAELLGGEDVAITAVGSSEAALEALDSRVFDCIVLDLKLPKMSGFDLLERIGGDERLRDIPVIVHTGKELTKREETKLRRYAKTIVVKDARSPERLVAETSLFLHRPESALGAEQRRLLEQVHTADAVFGGKKVLVVDDDVRNLFALASALEARGMEVLFAENGREGLDCLEENPDVDLVLMDLMMPEMDGYEATQALRERPEFKDLPIICLTAKAMKGDREKSIEAGASDYITKPVDIEQLLSLMQVWLYR
jgi:signal transduction histidine kinase/CheY-like chemotaxis protein